MPTPKENVLEAIHHREPSAIPYTHYVDDVLARRLDDHFGGRENWRKDDDFTVRILWPMEKESLGENAYLDPFGVKWLRSQGADHFVEPPLLEPDTGQIPHIDLVGPEEIERILDICRRNPDKFIYYQFTVTLGERLWCLRGMETYFRDIAIHRKFIEEAMDILVEMNMAALDKLLTLPIEGVTFGDDFGGQHGMLISPQTFREIFKPRLAQLFERVREAGKVAGFHSCGHNTPIMGDLVDIGLQVFHPLQPEAMDIAYNKREFGKDLTFRGGIGVQGRMVFGSPRDAVVEVLEATRILSEGGGYLIEPCKPLPAETPIENAIAAIEAISRASQRKFDLDWIY